MCDQSAMRHHHCVRSLHLHFSHQSNNSNRKSSGNCLLDSLYVYSVDFSTSYPSKSYSCNQQEFPLSPPPPVQPHVAPGSVDLSTRLAVRDALRYGDVVPLRRATVGGDHDTDSVTYADTDVRESGSEPLDWVALYDHQEPQLLQSPLHAVTLPSHDSEPKVYLISSV